MKILSWMEEDNDLEGLFIGIILKLS